MTRELACSSLLTIFCILCLGRPSCGFCGIDDEAVITRPAIEPIWKEIAARDGGQTFQLTVTPYFAVPKGQNRFCMAYKLPENETFYVVDITGTHDLPENHHEVHRCRLPGSYYPEDPYKAWDCAPPHGYECHGGDSFWNIRNSQPRSDVLLPPGIGYEVGQGVGKPFLVFSIHEVRIPRPFLDETTFTVTLVKKEEGKFHLRPMHNLQMYIYDVVPPKTRRQLESFFLVRQNVTLHPVKYTIHTHGDDASVWVVSPDGVWTLMGHEVEDGPEDRTTSVHPVHHPERVIRQGDRIAMRCIVVNRSSKPRVVRATGDLGDMCMSSLNYYPADGSALLPDEVLLNDGKFTWTDDPVLRPHHVSDLPLE